MVPGFQWGDLGEGIGCSDELCRGFKTNFNTEQDGEGRMVMVADLPRVRGGGSLRGQR